MSRAASRFEETVTAIEDLLRISPVAKPEEVAREARAAKHKALKAVGVQAQVDCMLSDAATQALFSALDGRRLVSREVVAAYCNCSTLTLERRLKAKYSRTRNGKAETWKVALQDPPPACDARGYFRWDFAQQFAYTWEAERGASKSSRASKKKLAVQLLGLLKMQFRFLQHRDGTFEGAWGQGGITVFRLIEILHPGGRLVTLSAPEALALPWANATMRAPWDRAVAAALEELAQTIARGRAQTSALGVEGAIGAVIPVPPPKRL